MSERFEGTSRQRQNNYEKIVYILDNLFQVPSPNPSFNINMRSTLTLIVRNLLQASEIAVISDVWNQALVNLTRAPVYFLPLVVELFSLVGPYEKANFWSQLQSFFANGVRNYQTGDTSIALMLESLIEVLPKIMRGTPIEIKQHIVDLNRTLNLVLMIPSPSASENEIISLLTEKEYEGFLFQVRQVQLHTMLCVIGSPDDLATLKQEMRNFFLHPAALAHPLCFTAAMATESFSNQNLAGINAWLRSDVAFNSFSQPHEKDFFATSLFLVAKWSICHPEWSKIQEKGVPNSTFFRKVINKMAHLITHDNSFIQDVGLSALKKLIEFYFVMQQMRSSLHVKKFPGVVKDLIELELFGSQQCCYINENSLRGTTALYLGKQFFQKLEVKLKDFSSEPSIRKALLLIGILAIPPSLKDSKAILWASSSSSSSAAVTAEKSSRGSDADDEESTYKVEAPRK